jgi:hypothetical protein
MNSLQAVTSPCCRQCESHQPTFVLHTWKWYFKLLRPYNSCQQLVLAMQTQMAELRAVAEPLVVQHEAALAKIEGMRWASAV